MQCLERHGIVTREGVLAEGIIGGFSGVYGVLKVLEERGQVRRGYFVAGLGAAQFALPGAVDALRSEREPADPLSSEPPAAVILAATDPAQPYGSVLSWPESSGRPARSAGAIAVLADGIPQVWFDHRSHHLVTFPAASGDNRWVTALIGWSANAGSRGIEIRKLNGGPASDERIVAALRSQGFVESYRGLVYRPSTGR